MAAAAPFGPDKKKPPLGNSGGFFAKRLVAAGAQPNAVGEVQRGGRGDARSTLDVQQAEASERASTTLMNRLRMTVAAALTSVDDVVADADACGERAAELAREARILQARDVGLEHDRTIAIARAIT